MTGTEVTDTPPVSGARPGTGRPAARDLGGSDVIAKDLARVRIAILFIGYLIVGAAAGGIFDHFEWELIGAPVLPTVAALLLVGRSGPLRALGAGTAIVMSVVLAVILGGGGAGDIIDAFTSGIQGLLSTDWPSPTRSDLIGAVVAVAATSTAVSDELAIRRRSHLLPLLPLLLCYLGVIALSAPQGVVWRWLILLGVVAAIFAMFRNEGTLHDRMVLLRGERRVIPLLLITIAVVAFIAIPVS
ncbi:MAG: hypothetical protein E4H05_02900, partial [Acidimicrobiales bacterium]